MSHKIYKLITLIVLSICSFSAKAAENEETLFTYPTPPDTMTQLQPRCDFIVSRFWERCNFNTAFRNPQKLNQAFRDWVFIMEHASADTVHASVNRLIDKFSRKGPETLAIANLAECWLFGDSGMISEEVYLPFARAAANNRKISNADKARFVAHVKLLENSMVGADVPNLEFIRPDGTRGNLGEIQGSSVLLFINDPDCDDCNLARVRLSADYNTKELIRRGELTIVSIYPAEPDEQWQAAASTYPENWVVCAIPDADEYFTLRSFPSFFFLNSRHKVLAKDLDINYLLGAFRVANIRSSQQ